MSKKITLEISDAVVSEVRSSIIAAKMTGSFYGILHEVCDKIIKSIEKNDETVTLKFKKETESEIAGG